METEFSYDQYEEEIEDSNEDDTSDGNDSSSDEDNYASNSDSGSQPSLKTRSMRPPIPKRLHQTKFRRLWAKEEATEDRVHGRICFS